MTPVGRVAGAFIADPSFLSFIMGPVGGGKTTACIAKTLRLGRAQRMVMDHDRQVPVKRCRVAVVRDTYPNLDRTVIRSWHQWFPKTLGRWSGDTPRVHQFTLNIGRPGTPGFHLLDLEMIFAALGEHVVEDVMRGFELTGLWPNEADLLPRSVWEYGVGRVGRYPAEIDGGCAMAQIFADFNAPEDDNHVVQLAKYRDVPTELAEAIALENGGKQPLIGFFQQPGGMEENAENLHNLPGGKIYYLKQAALLSKDKKRRLIDNLIGPVRAGTPVHPEFRDDIDVSPERPHGHVRRFELNPHLPILLFADQGLCGAATLAQLDPRIDQLRVFDEFARIFEDENGEIDVVQIGGEAFGAEIRGTIATRYPGLALALACCDPAGSAGEAAIGHRSWRQDFSKGLGVPVKPVRVPGNAFEPRIKAVRDRLNGAVAGEPRLIIHPRCAILRKAFNSKYVLRRVSVGKAGDRFDDKPLKIQGYADVMESLQYGCFELQRGLALDARGPASGRRRPVTNEAE